MRIVAGGARGLRIHDVITMAAIASLSIGGTERYVAEDAIAAVAFVAQGVRAGRFAREIRGLALPFQKGGKR